MPWRPSEPGEFPTLGHTALEFMTELLARPDAEDFEPFFPTIEQAEFLMELYRLDPVSGKRVVTRAGLCRPRGWGKSPFVSAIGIFEALGDAVPAGWDADGRPVGQPWRRVRTPIVQLVGVSEDQTKNAWDPLLQMLREDAPVFDVFAGLEPMQTQVNLPGGRGYIRPITSSAWTAKGGKPVCALLDQTEEYTRSNGGISLANRLIDNATKIGGIVVETPNAFIPGTDTQAERTATAAIAVKSGLAKLDRGFLWDHREAPAETDWEDRESLVAGLRVTYGDSSDHPDGCVIHDPPCPPGWSPIDGIADRFWHPDADQQELAADFLNQITHASDSFVSSPQWKSCADAAKVVADKDAIALGFDGSRGRAKGKPDATALIGCRMEDGHLFEIAVWEADDKKRSEWSSWAPRIPEIEAKLEETFTKYRVAAFNADPGRDWRSFVNAWEAKYVSRLVVPDLSQHPFEWWMTGGRSSVNEKAIESFYSAVAQRDLTHDGSFRLTQHMLNARRRLEHGKLALGKESSYSEKKIDAAVAAVLAYQARADVLGKWTKLQAAAPRNVYAPRRLR